MSLIQEALRKQEDLSRRDGSGSAVDGDRSLSGGSGRGARLCRKPLLALLLLAGAGAVIFFYFAPGPYPEGADRKMSLPAISPGDPHPAAAGDKGEIPPLGDTNAGMPAGGEEFAAPAEPPEIDEARTAAAAGSDETGVPAGFELTDIAAPAPLPGESEVHAPPEEDHAGERPAGSRAADKEEPARDSLRLTGIMTARGRERVAVINGRVVGPGETVAGARVIAIKSDRVILSREGREEELRVGSALE